MVMAGQKTKHRTILYQIAPEETNYINLLKGQFASRPATVRLNNKTPLVKAELYIRAKELKADTVLVSDPGTLKLIVGGDRKINISNYMGSVFTDRGIQYIVMPEIKQLVTIPYMKFVYNHFLDKIFHPEKWPEIPEFTWELFNPGETDPVVDKFAAADFISCDCETKLTVDRILTCIGFTAVKLAPTLQVYTVVIPMDDMYNVAIARTILDLPQMKVFQNGKYDIDYFLRYNIITKNYSGDTINMFHCWLSELPKDLGFISVFCIRNWEYWKDERKTTDLMEYYRYNAKDSYATAMSWLYLLLNVPQYALDNYKLEFPIVYPCILTEMTGLKRDNAAIEVEYKKSLSKIEAMENSLAKMTSIKNYNPSSSQQTLKLFEILGCSDIKSSDAIHRDKVADRHPLNKFLMDKITEHRELKKLASTYLRDESNYKKQGIETKTWGGRILYSLNPHGTDTGRLASNESPFWCGWQIQNIPYEMKPGIIADEGFHFGEGDYAQNEARNTAYISGDKNLIAVVDDPSKDFHGYNASQFFGIPYSDIMNTYYNEELLEWIHETVDKVIRDLSKRTNHGSNYNMGAQVLLDTMGIANVRRAKRLLNLPANWSLLRVTYYLLETYERTYPIIKGPHYDKIVADILNTGFLVGATGWTRRSFLQPDKNKRHLNSAVAHPPQSLAAMRLNTAYNNVFNNVAMPNKRDFKLGPQIHDSIFFQYRIGRDDLVWKVADEMRIVTPVTDIFGITRNLDVPVDMKGGAARWDKLRSMRRPKQPVNN